MPNSIPPCGDGRNLRLSPDGKHICSDCPDDGTPVDTCCKSNPAIAAQLGQPVNDCGLWVRTDPPDPPVIRFRRYCLLEARAELNITNPGSTQDAFGSFSGVCELVDPVTVETDIIAGGENRGCVVFDRALCRFQMTNVRGAETRAADYEYCGTFRLGCPPIGASATVNYIEPDGGQFFATVGFSVGTVSPFGGNSQEFGVVASFSPVDNVIGLGSTTNRTASWNSDGREMTQTTVTRYFAFLFGQGLTEVGQQTFFARYRVAHDLTCDDQPSPHTGGCPDLGGPCLAGPEAYLISEPCNPTYSGPVVVFRAENVAGCAVVPTVWGCMKISPASPAILNPSIINAAIDNRVVPVGFYPASCCECEPGCPSRPITTSPCWNGGVRNQLTGDWVPNSPFVTSGQCCCNPDDIITITQVDSLWETSGLTFHRTLQNPIVVRRGDPWFMDMDDLITVTATGEFVQQNQIRFGREDDPIAPFDCFDGPWSGSVNAQGFGPGNLQIPEGFVGLHHPATDGGVLGMPCPINGNGSDDSNPSIRVLSKNVSVTCTTFFYDGSWEWNGGPENGGSRVTHRLRLSITPAPNSQRPECSGGCGQNGNGGPPAGPGGPGAPTPFPGGPGIGGLMGGCGGCGRSGEL